MIDFIPDECLNVAQDSKYFVEPTHLLKSFKLSTLLFIMFCIEEEMLSCYQIAPHLPRVLASNRYGQGAT